MLLGYRRSQFCFFSVIDSKMTCRERFEKIAVLHSKNDAKICKICKMAVSPQFRPGPGPLSMWVIFLVTRMVPTSFIDRRPPEVPFLIPPKRRFLGIFGDFGGIKNGTSGGPRSTKLVGTMWVTNKMTHIDNGPGRCGHFATFGSILQLFVSELQLFSWGGPSDAFG